MMRHLTSIVVAATIVATPAPAAAVRAPLAPSSPAVSIIPTDLYRGTPTQAKREARRQATRYGWADGSQWRCLVALWEHESGWHWNSNNNDGESTWGVPQAHPGYKMRSAGPDWRTNVTTQIRWGLRYIRSSYGSPCRAWSRWQDRAASGAYGWY